MPENNSSAFCTRKRLIVVAISACFASAPAWSNPTAPQVVNGSASFNQAGKLLTVNNSNGAIINWNTFSIGAGETTRFNQVSTNSSVLNRVITNDPSVLLGTLSSNGRVWLVNPGGIMVGQGARIDVAGFIASTLNVRNEDFLAGRLNFGATPNAGSIQNYGQIATPSGGSVYLVAPAVENHGIINAPNGEVILAAGQTAQLIDTGTPGVKVDITGAEGNATNLGEIVAEAGRIGMAGVLVKNSGTLNASSVVREGGRIFLKASKDAYVDGAGRINTTGTKGGSIEVLGNRVAVMDQAQLDASGSAGGGTVLVGGDFQGKNPDIRNANITYFGPNASLKADAEKIGDGGTLIVWADDTTRAYGNISARGGANGGDGGLVETSGKRYLDVAGIKVRADAQNGAAGTWLLDPYSLTITASATDTVTAGGPPYSFTSGVGGTNVLNTDIKAQLDGGTSVTLQTSGAAGDGFGNGDITVSANIAKTAGGAATLLLKAHNDVVVGAGVGISSTSGELNVVLNSDSDGVGGGAIVMNTGSSITSKGGNITLGGGTAGNGTGNAIGNATYINGIYLTGAMLDAGGGNIALNGTGFAGTSSANGIHVTDTSTIQTGDAGTVTLNGTGGAGANDNNGVRIGTSSSITAANGATALTGDGGVSTGTTNMGVYVHNGAAITASGTGGITLDGTGGSTGTLGNSNRGVRISSGASVTANSGAIGITGQGGYDGDGVQLVNASTIQSTSGPITIAGTGGAGTNSIHGVYLDSSAQVATVDGAISLTGYGGAATGSSNYGVYVTGGDSLTGSSITSTGTGTITLDGTGGSGTNSNYGVRLSTGMHITSAAGDVLIAGQGGGNGGGTNNYGIIHTGYSGAVVTSNGSANITFDGRGKGGSAGVKTNAINGSQTTGNVTLIADTDMGTDSIVLTGSVSGAGNLLLQPLNPASTIGIAGGAGIFNLDTAELGYIQNGFANIGIGRTNGTGALTFGSGGTGYTFSDPVTLRGGDIAIGGALATGSGASAGGITLEAKNNIIVDSSITAQAQAVVLNSDFDGAGGGGIFLDTGSSITSNGGDITMGGMPSVGYAIGNGTITGGRTFNSGIYVLGNITAGAGDVTMYGEGASNDLADGITFAGGTLSSNGIVTIDGIAHSYGTNRSGLNPFGAGVNFINAGTRLTTQTGTVTVTGTNTAPWSGIEGAGGIMVETGAIVETTGAGTLTFNGAANSYGASWGVGVLGTIQTTAAGGGAVSLTGTNLNNADGGVVIWDGHVLSGGGAINLTGQTSSGGSAVGWLNTAPNALALGGPSSGNITIKGLVATDFIDFSPNGGFAHVINAGSSALSITSNMGFLLNNVQISAGNVTLNSGGAVTDNNASTSSISANTLRLLGTGSFNLGSVNNNVGTLAANVTGNVNYNGISGFAIGSVTSFDGTGVTTTTGVTTGNGDFTAIANNGGTPGNLTLNAGSAINTGSGALSLTAAGGNLNINGDVSAGTFTLSGGTWNQVSATLPAFTVNDFRIAGGTFIRALGGDGLTITSSYQLADIHGVQGMGSAGMLGKYYKLANDINAAGTASWNAGLGFSPVGNSTTAFTGAFDGLGRSISDLIINRSGESYVGLFGNNSGAINGVNLVDANVRGYYYVGALAGKNSGTVSNSSATGVIDGGEGYIGGLIGENTGSVVGSSADVTIYPYTYATYTGGLVGHNTSTGVISDSHADGNVYGTSTVYLGGLVGYNNGSISNAYATGYVTSCYDGSCGDNVGGLVGYNYYYGSVSNSHATGDVTGYNYVGGLVGKNDNDDDINITDAYASGIVQGNSYVGGLVGFNYYGQIERSYATGDVIGAGTKIGGLIGYNNYSISNVYATGNVSVNSYIASRVGGLVGNNDGSIVNAYATGSVNSCWDGSCGDYVGGLVGYRFYGTVSNSYHATGSVTGGNTVGGLIGYNRGDITDSYNSGSVSGINYVGGLVGEHTGSNTISNSYNSGSVSGGDYVGGLVGYNTYGDYATIANSYNTGDVSGANYVGGLVGRNDDVISSSYSTGSVTGTGGYVGGLVGYNDYDGTIGNAYATGNVDGSYDGGINNIGGLVGYNTGSIDNAYATGNVSGGDRVGGLVGHSDYGFVSNSYATGNVSGGDRVGGLVGYNENDGGTSITNAYASGGVTGSYEIGGLVGYNYSATINDSYSTGFVTGTGSVGGLVGSNDYGYVNNSFWDTDTSGQSFSAGGDPKITAEMKQLATFDVSGWSIADTGGSSATWRIYEGSTTPLLRSFLTLLTVAANADSRTFDGSAYSGGNGVTYSPVASPVVSGTLAYTGTSQGAVNVGGYAITPSGLFSTQQQGYDISYGPDGVLTIDPAIVSASSVNLSGTRAYDGTVNVAAGIFTLGGLVSGQDLTLSGVGTVADKNVGVNKPVNLGSLTLGNGTNGLASNYTFAGGTQVATITPAPLTVAGLTAQNKVYDTTTVATLTGGTLTGVIAGDAVSIGTPRGSFNNKNVGSAKPVTVSGLTLSGADAGNYSFTPPSGATLTADITPASLTLTGLTAQNKVYDATTVATISGTAAFSGVLGTDVVTLGGNASGSFADKNVGVAKPVSVTGLTLSGTDAGNYTLANTSASTSADITPASLTVSGLTAQNKVYDATTVATITGTAVFSGVLGTDVVAPGGSASASFADKNVGTAKPVAVSGLSLSGTDAGNYTLSSASIAADITRASLSLSGVVAANKVYDGTTLATLSGGTLAGAFSGDIVSFSGSGNFADKNVGAAKEVTVSVTALTGTDAGNYKLSGPTATTADITVRPLSTWKGGASGNWSEAANWDALPDLSNVLAVSVPTGSVTYDAAAGSTSLGSLTAAGLAIAGGSLNIANNLTVSSSFSQSGGALGFGGGASAIITQASGSLNVPALALANLSLAAPAGAITQSGAIVAAALNTQSQTGTTITNSGNRVGSFTAANNGSGNVALTNTGALTIAGISNSGGNISIDNTGAVSTTGAVSAPSGTVSILAHSPLNIGAAGVSAAGSIALTADATAGSGDTLTLTGPISSTGSGGSIALFAGDDLVQNANVTTNGGAVSALSQTGNISMALGTTTSSGGGSIDYAASSGDVVLTSLNAGSGAIALNAGKGIQPAPGYTGANLIGGNAVIVSGGSANLSTQVRLLDVTVEGRFSVTDILTGTVFTDVPAAAPLPILNQVVSTVVATTQQQPTQATSQTAAPPPPPPPPTTSGGSGPLLLSNTTQTIGGTADTFGGSSFVDSLPATAAGSSSGTPSSGQGDKPAADKRAADKPADDKLASAKKEDAKADDKKDEKKDDDKKKGEETTAKKEDRPAAKKLPTCGR